MSRCGKSVVVNRTIVQIAGTELDVRMREVDREVEAFEVANLAEALDFLTNGEFMPATFDSRIFLSRPTFIRESGTTTQSVAILDGFTETEARRIIVAISKPID